MKKQLLSTIAASVLMLSASVVQAQDAPSRTECIAPAKPGGGFGLYNAYQELIKYGGAIRLCATPAGQGALFEIMLKRIDHE